LNISFKKGFRFEDAAAGIEWDGFSDCSLFAAGFVVVAGALAVDAAPEAAANLAASAPAKSPTEPKRPGNI
jgi:hypothetical protein